MTVIMDNQRRLAEVSETYTIRSNIGRPALRKTAISSNNIMIFRTYSPSTNDQPESRRLVVRTMSGRVSGKLPAEVLSPEATRKIDPAVGGTRLVCLREWLGLVGSRLATEYAGCNAKEPR